jgi:hypothetical protein
MPTTSTHTQDDSNPLLPDDTTNEHQELQAKTQSNENDDMDDEDDKQE